ncbi:efflux RND transporter periplasmic adaptor subunit [Candidatus Symbiothrix dinenymphae]|uniref:efflux RND transporter periplasmic adaptor subunit n=1 Tax=Candidatus Symbiothrix dinenymphae TaxID=467085 RepID=UPI0006E39DA1|nr:efflux RND transporter periplasmic adaptor subunit [Candidatus Symbiothrix dinenymphae]
MKKGNFGKIVLFTAIGLVVVFTFWFLWAKSRPKVLLYDIVTPEMGNIENQTVATGTIEPRDEILIKPQISGIITEVTKIAGQRVTVGEVLARVKVIPEMGSLNSAESRMRIAKIEQTKIEQEFARQTSLYANEVISKEEFEASEAAYNKAKEETSNAVSALDIVRDGVTGRYAHLSNTQIRSTIAGMILDVPVKVGNSVIQANTFNDGTTIASVADMNDLLFVGTIDETEVGKIKEGMPLRITIGAIDNQQFDAVLEYIAPKGTSTNGAVLFQIKAAVQIPPTTFVRAGYSANAQVVLQRMEDVLKVPESALEFSGDSTFVYVLTDSLAQTGKQDDFERRQVKIGMSNGIDVEIQSGITLNDKLRGNEIDPKKIKN